MERTKLADRTLPSYTKGEEIFNMVTHIVGAAVCVAALVLCVVFAAIKGNAWGVVGCSIYGATMIVLYCMSSIYHGLSPRLTAKKVFQIIDHCSIFLLIAGTYTPIALCSLREYHAAVGWCVFVFNWGMAAIGIVLNAIDLKKYKTFSMVCYLVMGWCVIAAAKATYLSVGLSGVIFLLAGGVSYTVGAVIYGVGKKRRYMHSLFHIFVVVGSILQFFAIFFWVI